MFKINEDTANVTMDLANKIEEFLKTGLQHYPDRVQEFAQATVKHYNIPEIEYVPAYKGIKHGFDSCSVCNKYTHQTLNKSLLGENWTCDSCGKNTN